MKKEYKIKKMYEYYYLKEPSSITYNIEESSGEYTCCHYNNEDDNKVDFDSAFIYLHSNKWIELISKISYEDYSLNPSLCLEIIIEENKEIIKNEKYTRKYTEEYNRDTGKDWG